MSLRAQSKHHTFTVSTTGSIATGRPLGCDAHREWIEPEVQLGRNAISVYQDLVETHGFTHRHNSVKRFVRTLKVREPERFDVTHSKTVEQNISSHRGPPWSAEEGSNKGANRAL